MNVSWRFSHPIPSLKKKLLDGDYHERKGRHPPPLFPPVFILTSLCHGTIVFQASSTCCFGASTAVLTESTKEYSMLLDFIHAREVLIKNPPYHHRHRNQEAEPPIINEYTMQCTLPLLHKGLSPVYTEQLATFSFPAPMFSLFHDPLHAIQVASKNFAITGSNIYPCT